MIGHQVAISVGDIDLNLDGAAHNRLTGGNQLHLDRLGRARHQTRRVTDPLSPAIAILVRNDHYCAAVGKSRSYGSGILIPGGVAVDHRDRLPGRNLTFLNSYVDDSAEPV